MNKRSLALGFLLPLTACVQPPQSPMEQQARLAMAAQFAAQNCGGLIGGYDGAKQMKEDANKSIVLARNLGATDAVFAQAKADVKSTFDTAVIFTDRQSACNDLVSQVAWHSN